MHFLNNILHAEMGYTAQGEGTTVDKFGDTQAQTPTVFVKL
jgi:hypothetical protein